MMFMDSLDGLLADAGTDHWTDELPLWDLHLYSPRRLALDTAALAARAWPA